MRPIGIPLFLLLLVLFMHQVIHASSRTVFVPRSITFDSTYELALTNYDIHHALQCNEKKVHLFITPFYQKSRNTHALARYFLPDNKTSITVKEDGTGDVGSLWLLLLADKGSCFSSRVCFAPRRKAYGTVFTAFFDFESVWEGGWLSLNTALIGVEHTLGITEQVHTPGILKNKHTVCQAFKNSTYKHGRVACRPLKKHGLDDIQLKLGYSHPFKPELHAGGYLVLGIPTSKQPTDEFLFEPLVGSNHAALGFGLESFYSVYNTCTSQNITLMADFKYLYVFKAQERRSLDLKNSNWSRFLQVSSARQPVYSKPAINIVSTCVTVKPRSTIDFWSAVHYTYDEYNVEVGYNLWWRQQEQVCLSPFINTKKYALFDLNQIGHVKASSASTARIHQTILGANAIKSDKIRIALDKKALNKSSAEHPPALTHKLYAAFSTNCTLYSYPLFIGIGGSYEFTRYNSALENWALFAKFGAHF